MSGQRPAEAEEDDDGLTTVRTLDLDRIKTALGLDPERDGIAQVVKHLESARTNEAVIPSAEFVPPAGTTMPDPPGVTITSRYYRCGDANGCRAPDTGECATKGCMVDRVMRHRTDKPRKDLACASCDDPELGPRSPSEMTHCAGCYFALELAHDAVRKERDKFKERAEVYEKDWYEAKSEFGDAMAKASARIRELEEQRSETAIRECSCNALSPAPCLCRIAGAEQERKRALGLILSREEPDVGSLERATQAMLDAAEVTFDTAPRGGDPLPKVKT